MESQLPTETHSRRTTIQMFVGLLVVVAVMAFIAGTFYNAHQNRREAARQNLGTQTDQPVEDLEVSASEMGESSPVIVPPAVEEIIHAKGFYVH